MAEKAYADAYINSANNKSDTLCNMVSVMADCIWIAMVDVIDFAGAQSFGESQHGVAKRYS
jgi:hypothetical protein